MVYEITEYEEERQTAMAGLGREIVEAIYRSNCLTVGDLTMGEVALVLAEATVTWNRLIVSDEIREGSKK